MQGLAPQGWVWRSAVARKPGTRVHCSGDGRRLKPRGRPPANPWISGSLPLGTPAGSDRDLHGVGRRSEPKRPRDERGGPKAGVAVETHRFTVASLGADRANLARDIRKHGCFRRAHARDAQLPAVARKAMVAPESSAQAGQKTIMRDAAEVPDSDGGGVASAAGSPADDDGDARHMASRDHAGLVGHRVNGVEDDVGPSPVVLRVRAEEAGQRGLRDKLDAGLDGNAGLDVTQAPGHDVGLGEAEGGLEGMKLAVDVGDAHLVKVHEGDAPHAGASKGLGSPGSNASDPSHKDMGGAQSRERGATVKPGNASKAKAEVVGVGNVHATGCGEGSGIRAGQPRRRGGGRSRIQARIGMRSLSSMAILRVDPRGTLAWRASRSSAKANHAWERRVSSS